MDNYTWDYIQKHPKETKRLLGIDYNQLRQLIEKGKILRQKKQEEVEVIIQNFQRKNKLF